MAHWTREERSARLLVDCPTLIEWKGWEPAGEYVKPLVIRNSGTRSQVFRYSQPTTSVFHMPFPDPIPLAAGMSITVPVSFKPTELGTFEDFIELQVPRGSVKIAFRATTGKIGLSFEPALDFQFCAVGEASRRSLKLKNSGDVPTSFAWSFDHGSFFSVHPSSGFLQPGKSVTLSAEFRPTEASSYSASAVCTAGQAGEQSQHSYTLQLSGVGKYPHLSLETASVNFGEVLTGSTAQATVNVINKSLVPGRFRVEPVRSTQTGPEPPVFHFEPSEGVVPGEGSFPIRVRYTPVATGAFSSEHFAVFGSSPEGDLVVSGLAMGPQVTVQPPIVDFGDVAVGSTSRRVVVVRNHGKEKSVEVSWDHCDSEWLTVTLDRSGLVGHKQDSRNAIPLGAYPCAEIGPNDEACFILQITPRRPIQFFDRVPIHVRDAAAPLGLDVLATGFDMTVKDTVPRPFSFGPRHIALHRARMAHGLGAVTPEEIQRLVRSSGQSLNEKDSDLLRRLAQAHSAAESDQQSQLQEPNTPSSPAMCSFARLDKAELDFGRSLTSAPAEPKLVYLTNLTGSKLTANWMAAESGKSGSPTSGFKILPPVADIPPHGTASFRVHFSPPADGCYYATKLTCFVTYAINRIFSLVDDDSFVPPAALKLNLIGHSFPPGNDHFVSRPLVEPRAHISTGLPFPSAAVGTWVQQTLSIRNMSETTPMSFRVSVSLTSAKNSGEHGNPNQQEDESSSLVALRSSIICTPSSGIIAPGAFTVVTLRSAPTRPGTHLHVAHLVANYGVSDPTPLLLAVSGATPQLAFPDGNDVFIKPTLINTVTSRSFSILNPAAIPTRFQIEIPAKHRNVLHVEPSIGVLRGNEKLPLQVSFAPRAIGSFTARVIVTASPLNAPSSSAKSGGEQQHTIRVHAEGWHGGVRVEPPTLDMGALLVNKPHIGRVTLYNDGECDLMYAVEPRFVSPSMHGGDEDPDTPYAAADISFLEPKTNAEGGGFGSGSGVITARTHLILEFELRPNQPLDDLVIALECHVWLPSGPAARNSQSPPVVTTHVLAKSGFPVIEIADVRSISALSPPKDSWWKCISANSLNSHFATPPSKPSAISKYRPFGDIMAMLDHFPMDLGAAPVGTQPTSVDVQIRNPGPLPTAVSLHFPPDLEVDVATWAKETNMSPEGRYIRHILDRKLFSISSKKLEIAPGESQVVTFAYSHHGPQDTHLMPIVMAVKDGQECILDLRARTLGQYEPFVEVLGAPASIPGKPDLSATPSTILDAPAVNNGGGGAGRALSVSARSRSSSRPDIETSSVSANFPGMSEPPAPPPPPTASAAHATVLLDNITSGPPNTQEASIRIALPPRALKTGHLIHIPLRNASWQETATIRLDPRALDSIQVANHGFRLLESVVPSETDGNLILTLSPGETSHLVFLARPLQSAAPYMFMLPLTVERGNSINLMLELYIQENEVDLFSRLPSIATHLSAPGQIAHLIPEVVTLSTVPAFSIQRRIVTVANSSTSCSAEFHWVTSASPFAQGQLEVEPQRGVLAPGQRAYCTMVLRSGPQSQLFDADIPCIITNLSNTDAPQDISRMPTPNSSSSDSVSEFGPSSSRSNVYYRAVSNPVAKPPRTSVVTASTQVMNSTTMNTSFLRDIIPPVIPDPCPPKPAPQALAPYPTFLRLQAAVDTNIPHSDSMECFIPSRAVVSEQLRVGVANPDRAAVNALPQDHFECVEQVITAMLRDIVRDPELPPVLWEQSQHQDVPFFTDVRDMVAAREGRGATEEPPSESAEKPQDSSIQSSAFQCLIEDLLQGTLGEIMKEATEGKFSLTAQRKVVKVVKSRS